MRLLCKLDLLTLSDVFADFFTYVIYVYTYLSLLSDVFGNLNICIWFIFKLDSSPLSDVFGDLCTCWIHIYLICRDCRVYLVVYIYVYIFATCRRCWIYLVMYIHVCMINMYIWFVVAVGCIRRYIYIFIWFICIFDLSSLSDVFGGVYIYVWFKNVSAIRRGCRDIFGGL